MEKKLKETRPLDRKAFSEKMKSISKIAARHAREAEKAASKAFLTH